MNIWHYIKKLGGNLKDCPTKQADLSRLKNKINKIKTIWYLTQKYMVQKNNFKLHDVCFEDIFPG